MARSIVTGIDIGTFSTETVVMESRGGEGLRILGTGASRSEGIRRGCVINESDVRDAVKASVREAERTSGLAIKRAYISVGGTGLSSIRSKGTVVVSRADGEITTHDVKRAIAASEVNLSSRITNKQIIHTYPLFYTVDGEIKTHQPAGIKGAKLEVETLFVVCLSHHLSGLIKSVESAGIAVEDVIASPLAAARALLTKNQKEAGVVMVNIGGGTVSLAAFEEGVPLSVEVLSIGSGHITNDIALGLQTSIEEAENLKIAYASESGVRKKLSEIIEPRLSDIFELVEGHLKKIGRNGLLPAGVVLAGGGSNIFNVVELARASLRLPAQLGAARLEGLNQKMRDLTWAVSLGLCLFALDENSGFGSEGEIVRRTKNLFLHWLRSFLP